jgi:hypothetical protein
LNLLPFGRVNKFSLLSLTRRFHLSRYRVISVSAPGMASEYSAYGKVEPLEWSVLAESIHGILATSGSEAACRWGERRYARLVETDGQYQYLT